jgi:hypothetical protein
MTRIVATLAIALLLISTAHADIEPEPSLPVEGIAVRPRAFADDNHAIRYILKYLVKVEPHRSFEELDPNGSVLMILGNTAILDSPDVSARFRNFVQQGGSVFIATEHDTAKAVQRALGIRVVGGEPWVRTQDAEDAYRGRLDCPLIREFNTSYSIFQGVGKIATNQAGRVEATKESGAISVAPFPASCRREGDKAIPSFAMLAERPLLRSGEGPSQRIIVLSDHSVFINGMILQKDNNNITFAMNCIRWVCEPEDGAVLRTKVLLVHDGLIEPSFDVQVKQVPSTLPSDLPTDLPAHPVDLINGILAKWEDENIHNEIILGGSSWRQILSGAAIALSIVLIIYGLFRIQQAHYRVETGR